MTPTGMFIDCKSLSRLLGSCTLKGKQPYSSITFLLFTMSLMGIDKVGKNLFLFYLS